MNNFLILLLIGSIFVSQQTYNAPTKASVCLAGGIIKAQSIKIEKKYKRKDCPVCKGKGWYISGDGIAKVDCGYCEPEKTDGSLTVEKPVTHPPVVIKQNCPDGSCTPKNNR